MRYLKVTRTRVENHASVKCKQISHLKREIPTSCDVELTENRSCSSSQQHLQLENADSAVSKF